MKRILVALGLSFSLISGAFAYGDGVEQLNSEIKNVLVPFQDSVTSAEVVFETVETDSERALKVALNSHYRKVGPAGSFEVRLDNFDYTYGDGLTPTTVIKGSVGLDFTKIIPQDSLNIIISYAKEVLENLITDNSPAYGDAISIHVVITSKTKDKDNNYTALSALASVKVDLSKLPADIPSEDVMVTQAMVSLDINLKTGVAIEAFLISNPAYKEFTVDNMGLKKILDDLLAGNEEQIAHIREYVKRLDVIAYDIVNVNQMKNHFLSLANYSVH